MGYQADQIRPGDHVELNLVDHGYTSHVSGTVVEVQVFRYLNMDELALEGSEISYAMVEEVLVRLAGIDELIDVSNISIREIDTEGEGE